MDYEKKLALAKEALDSGSYDKETIEYIFPELKESGNIRIIKAIKYGLDHVFTNNTTVFEVTKEQCLAWLEKQGEQKSIDDLTQQEAMDIAVAKCFEQGEQKPADKVEPKFHKDDWIIHQGTENIYQVVAVIDNQYQLKYGDNYTIQNCADVDRCARLWDITKDAKDGDVLCCESGWTCIFKALNNHTNTFSSYCFMDSDKWFCNTGSECHTLDKAFIKAYNGKIHPATKEQRDLLFAKMKEAGYEWDAEKKELKKVEQKDVYTKQQLRDMGFAFDTNGNIVTLDVINEGIKEYLANEKKKWEKEQKSAWSEEDEYNIAFIVELLYGIEDSDKEYENKCRKTANWLKSLIPHNTWKPSDEQIKALEMAINEQKEEYGFTSLDSLYEQLKAL